MGIPGELVQLYSSAGLPNPLAPECLRVEIMSTKYFLYNATWNGSYGYIAWVVILQPNVETLEHRAPEHAACGLAVHTPCGALYHSAGEIATYSIECTICSTPAGSKSDQLALE